MTRKNRRHDSFRKNTKSGHTEISGCSDISRGYDFLTKYMPYRITITLLLMLELISIIILSFRQVSEHGIISLLRQSIVNL